MVKKNVKSYVFSAIAALLLLCVSLALLPARANAASNKAIRLKVAFDGTDSDWDNNTFSIDTCLKKTSKVKSGITITSKIYVPKTLLKKNGDSIGFCNDLMLLTYNSKEKYYQGVGSINKTRWFFISKDGKNLNVNVYNEKKDKTEADFTVKENKAKSSKYVSVKTKGKYYVITLIDKLGNTYYDYAADKEKKLNTKKTYTLVHSLVVHGECSKLSGYIYLDELSVNAVKKQTITYDKKDYKTIGGSHFGGKNWKKNAKRVTM